MTWLIMGRSGSCRDVEEMGVVDREMRRELSDKREGRRTSPATASLGGDWSDDERCLRVCMCRCMVSAGEREDVEWSRRRRRRRRCSVESEVRLRCRQTDRPTTETTGERG